MAVSDFRMKITGHGDNKTVFACVPCECGGMCDKCRQTERGGEGSSQRTADVVDARRSNDGATPERLPRSAPRSVCLCDPDTDAVCDRECA